MDIRFAWPDSISLSPSDFSVMIITGKATSSTLCLCNVAWNRPRPRAWYLKVGGYVWQAWAPGWLISVFHLSGHWAQLWKRWGTQLSPKKVSTGLLSERLGERYCFHQGFLPVDVQLDRLVALLSSPVWGLGVKKGTWNSLMGTTEPGHDPVTSGMQTYFELELLLNILDINQLILFLPQVIGAKEKGLTRWRVPVCTRRGRLGGFSFYVSNPHRKTY